MVLRVAEGYTHKEEEEGVRFDWSLFLHSHMAILFDWNESCRTGSNKRINDIGNLTGVFHQISSKAFKATCDRRFCRCGKDPKTVEGSAKGYQIWYFHFCGVIWLFSRYILIFG